MEIIGNKEQVNKKLIKLMVVFSSAPKK